MATVKKAKKAKAPKKAVRYAPRKAKPTKAAKEPQPQLPAKREEAEIATRTNAGAPVIATGTGTGGGALVLPGISGFMPGDFVVPRRTMVQPTSKQGTQGYFMSMLDVEDEKISVRGYLIKADRGRVMFPKRDDSEVEDTSQPLCGSDNGLVPANRFEEPYSETCVLRTGTRETPVCQYSAWGADKTPPPCATTWSMLIFDMEDGLPFWITFSKTSWNPATTFLSTLIAKMEQSKRAATCCCAFTMSAELQVNQKGKYFTVKFAKFSTLGSDEFEDAMVQFQKYSGEEIDKTLEEEDRKRDSPEGGRDVENEAY